MFVFKAIIPQLMDRRLPHHQSVKCGSYPTLLIHAVFRLSVESEEATYYFTTYS